MQEDALRALLEGLRTGSFDVEQVEQKLRDGMLSDLGFARVDHDRELRQGAPEVVFGENKTAEQIIAIVGALRERGQNVLVTRVHPDKAARASSAVPHLQHDPVGRTLSLLVSTPEKRLARPIAVVTAGTSDGPVAQEAIATLRLCGLESLRFDDVGVAGIHRLFDVLPRIRQSAAVICLAGMEGALPSVLGGLVRVPVVAVPTSVGYGAALGGMTALFGMLTGCAAGVTVVNVDNGFGAAMAVFRMVSLLEEPS